MEKLTKLIRLLTITVIITSGVFIGITASGFTQIAVAEEQNDCGTCDYDDREELEFCNFTWNTGQCAGNDGGDCGNVPCVD